MQLQRDGRADVPGVTFLTRAGCPGSPLMLARLRAALAGRGVADVLEIMDVGELPDDDPRTGYGTPTILVGGSDLFGRAKPAPAAPT